MKPKKKKITKSMTFAEILKNNPEAAYSLFNEGMSCCGCPMAHHETLEQGAKAHGLDPNKLLNKINKAKKIENKKRKIKSK